MLSPVEAIKGKLSIVDVVGSYVKLEKAGVNYKARCPFHNEKTPSFFVSPGRETYHCFGCGKGGDMFSFVEEVEGVEFREALKVLAERAGVNLAAGPLSSGPAAGATSRLRLALQEGQKFYEGELVKNKQVQTYLKERGLENETIKSFHLGFAPDGWRNLSDHLKKRGVSEADAEKAGLLIKGDKGYYDRFRGRIMFPFFDYSGRIIGFSGRILPGSPDEATTGTSTSFSAGKYINSPETPLFNKSRVFYCLDQAKYAIRETGKMLLVEGQLDVLLAYQVGTKNTVAVSGTALTDEHIKIIRRMVEHLVLVLDGDEAGFRASERSVRMALATGLFVSVVPMPAGSDPADCIKRDPKEWMKLVASEQPYVTYALSMIKSNFKRGGDLQKAVREYLYPSIIEMYNEIEKDSALQEISSILGVSADAVRDDFKKWAKTHKSTTAVEPLGPGGSTAGEKQLEISSGLEMIASRLWGISMAFVKFDARAKMQVILGEELFAHFTKLFEGDRHEDVIFQAESYYPAAKESGEGLESEIESLLARLSQEVWKEHFTRAMDDLRKAELSGDKKEVARCLEICQNISKELGTRSLAKQ